MAVADRHGLPIAIGIGSGERHETRLVHSTLEQCFTEQLPERLIGDRAYDSDPLDKELADLGIEMIAPHNPTRKRKTQDGRPLRRYRRRWRVERLFSWLFQSRRIVTRYEYNAANFLGFVQLACIRILLRWL
jgi:transposase